MPSRLQTLKMLPLVAEQLSRDSEVGEHFFHQVAGSRFSTLVGHRVRLGPLCKVAHSPKDVAVARLGGGERAEDVQLPLTHIDYTYKQPTVTSDDKL